MYLWMRNLHLFLGGLFALFLLVYGASAVQMAHPDWFPMKPATTESRVPVEAGAAARGPRALARYFIEEHGLRGEVNRVKQTENGYEFRIVRPGTVYVVEYSPGSREAHVTTQVATFLGMLNRIHHLGGLWHEYPLLNLWGGLVGLTSLGLILLGVSGLYLWFRIHRERLVGTILLALSLATSLGLWIAMRTAGS